MDRVGEILLGKYRVERELGRGGMGVVYAARHLELGEAVAIKLLLPESEQDADLVRRFVREARASARIRSEHVCRVTDVGRLPGGEPYMVMELLHGQDLDQVLAANGPLPIADAVEYVLQAIEAIAEAHAASIVHRDLKPANLFLTRKRNGAPCIKVLDFGISKLADPMAPSRAAATHTMALLGSPFYMPPEQLESSTNVDARADLWAIGVMLHQLLTAQLPYVADSLPGLVLRVMREPPAPLRQRRPEVPVELEAVILRCLEKDRAARWPDAASLAAALAPFAPVRAAHSLEVIRSFANGHAATERPPPPSAPASSRRATSAIPTETLSAVGSTNDGLRSSSRRVWLAAAALVALIGGGAVALGAASSSAQPRPSAARDEQSPAAREAAASTAMTSEPAASSTTERAAPSASAPPSISPSAKTSASGAPSGALAAAKPSATNLRPKGAATSASARSSGAAAALPTATPPAPSPAKKRDPLEIGLQ